MKTSLLVAALTASAQAGRVYYVEAIYVEDDSVTKDFNADQMDDDKKRNNLQNYCTGSIADGDFECDLGKGKVVSASISSYTDECIDYYTVDGSEDGKYTTKVDETQSYEWGCESNYLIKKAFTKNGCSGDATINGVAEKDCQYDKPDEEKFCGTNNAASAISYLPHTFDCGTTATADDYTYLGYSHSGANGVACFHDADGEGLYTKAASKAFFFGFDGSYGSTRAYFDAACKDDQVYSVGWAQSTECSPMAAACNGYDLEPWGIEQGYGADSLGNTWMKEKAVYTNSYKNGSLWCTARYSDDKCETMVDDMNIYASPTGAGSAAISYGQDRAVWCESLFGGQLNYGKCVPTGYYPGSEKQDAFMWSKSVVSPASVIAPAVAILAPVLAALM
jgi:hypothetical protein